jgi:hypothetical protein
VTENTPGLSEARRKEVVAQTRGLPIGERIIRARRFRKKFEDETGTDYGIEIAEAADAPVETVREKVWQGRM